MTKQDIKEKVKISAFDAHYFWGLLNRQVKDGDSNEILLDMITDLEKAMELAGTPVLTKNE